MKVFIPEFLALVATGLLAGAFTYGLLNVVPTRSRLYPRAWAQAASFFRSDRNRPVFLPGFARSFPGRKCVLPA